MKIYTKKGDKGITSLFGGKKVPKYHIRVEAYGSIDELNSYIGLLRDQPIDESIKTTLLKIQNELFNYFVTHPDTILSKQTLMVDVWGRIITENSVDQFISILRKNDCTIYTYCNNYRRN